jgi:hypothetical protein
VRSGGDLEQAVERDRAVDAAPGAARVAGDAAQKSVQIRIATPSTRLPIR